MFRNALKEELQLYGRAIVGTFKGVGWLTGKVIGTATRAATATAKAASEAAKAASEAHQQRKAEAAVAWLTMPALLRVPGSNPIPTIHTAAQMLPAGDKEISWGCRHFFDRVAGVSFKNDNGTSRQKIVAQLRAAERLLAFQQTSGERGRHKFGVALYRSNGEQVGWLPSELGQECLDRAKHGERYAFFVAGTGQVEDGNWGARILIVIATKTKSDAGAQQYMQSLPSKGVFET